MNQSIQFPDREQWLEDQKYVLFPIMVNGMLFDCQITEQELKVRFGDNSNALCLFKQHRWEIEEEFEVEIPDEVASNMKTVKDIVDYIEANK